MEASSTQHRVRVCSKCPGDAEYFCASCPCDLCSRCSENHVNNLKTIDHVVILRKTYNYMLIHELCITHPGKDSIKDCEPCENPVCSCCRKHKNHKQNVVQNIIQTIRKETLFSRYIFLERIKTEVKDVPPYILLYQSELSAKAKTLKNIVDYVLYDLLNNVFCDFDFKHRCLKQKFEKNRHIARIQKFEYRNEQSAISPVMSIKSWKNCVIPEKHVSLHTNHFLMTGLLNKKDVIDSICTIKIEGKKHCVGNEFLLKLMPSPEFHQSITLTNADRCNHITFVTSDKIWVSDEKNIMLTNATGNILRDMGDMSSEFFKGYGIHTVSRHGELIYIDGKHNINKLSKNMKTVTPFIQLTDEGLLPQCIYCSPFTGDLLVGVLIFREASFVLSGVKRYNQSGQLTQTIQNNKKERTLFKRPGFITENNNGDVVVSDYWSGAVVVTDREGTYRFSYKGPPSVRHPLMPNGICTDALSHILVCYGGAQTVHIIDKDGYFLSYLLIRPSGIFYPSSISYDVNTHRIWVGSEYYNKMCVFRYITRQDVKTDPNKNTKDVAEPINEVEIIETCENRTEKRMKLIFQPKLLHSRKKKNMPVEHISFLASDRIWVRDACKFSLMKTKGKSLHHQTNLHLETFGVYSGRHAENSDFELFYIHNDNNNIYKLTKDKKNTLFIMKSSSWEYQCVYWSTSTNDLLVGMYREDKQTGLVSRYNQNGQRTQTIQHDSIGLELYCKPCYITENHNGDVVVSDFGLHKAGKVMVSNFHAPGAVVVTDYDGRHRFSYTGPQPESIFQPLGICTDSMSHILVCDTFSRSIQLLHKDGQFLCHLEIEGQLLFFSYFSYDVFTNCLEVRPQDNDTYFKYRHVNSNEDPGLQMLSRRQ